MTGDIFVLVLKSYIQSQCFGWIPSVFECVPWALARRDEKEGGTLSAHPAKHREKDVF